MPGSSYKAHIYSYHWVMLLVASTSTESGETSHPLHESLHVRTQGSSIHSGPKLEVSTHN